VLNAQESIPSQNVKIKCTQSSSSSIMLERDLQTLKMLDQILIFKKMKEETRMILITMIPEENSIMTIVGEIKSILKTILKAKGILLKIIPKSGEMIEIKDMRRNQIIQIMNKTIKNIQDGKKMGNKSKSKAN
jgi:hypothetical protein